MSYFISGALRCRTVVFSAVGEARRHMSRGLICDLFKLSATSSPCGATLRVILTLGKRPGSPFCGEVGLCNNGCGGASDPPLSRTAVIGSVITLVDADLQRSRGSGCQREGRLEA